MALQSKYYFQISPSSGVPIYRQIIDQVKIHIASGRLKEGEFLPSVRQVAKELEVNPMTVSKAYSLLEREAVLKMARGQGMQVVATARSEKDLTAREADIAPLLKEAIARARQASLGQKHFSDLIKRFWEDKP